MRKLLWLFLILACPGLAMAQAGNRFDSVAQRNVQNFLAPIPGATITLCTAGATGTPCSPLVPTIPPTLCTDSTCSVAASNSFLADSNGNFGGWLLPGNYVYSITAPGVTGKLFSISIPPTVPINLATQTTGTLPGANMAAVNLATSGNGGVTGTLPGANYAAVNLAAGNVNGGVSGALPAANLPATTSNCANGAGFAQGLNAGGTPICGSRTIAIEYVIDNAGSALSTGVKGDLVIPFACTLSGVTLLADQSGSVVVDIWKNAYSGFPPTVANTITASAIPTISSATKYQDLTLTGWTKTVNAGDTLRFNVNSDTTITRVTVALQATIP